MSDAKQTPPTEHSPYCSKQIGPASECYICNPAIEGDLVPPKNTRTVDVEFNFIGRRPAMPIDDPQTTDQLRLSSKDDRGRAAEYLDKALHSFIIDPPDTDFQRGYQEALRETYRVLLGRFP